MKTLMLVQHAKSSVSNDTYQLTVTGVDLLAMFDTVNK